MNGGGNFWRLRHEDLAAVLRRTDLSWESARVYLALADLTRGYGKDRDTVSLGQISKATGIERRHVSRAIGELTKLGLYEQAEKGDNIDRWVTWPAPGVPEPGNRQGVPKGVPKGVPGFGGGGVPKGVPNIGAHQDSKTGKTTKTTSAALGELPVEIGERPGMMPSPEVDLAGTWEELLKLDRLARTDERDAGDFQALVTVAQDLQAGKLGPAESATASLLTLAHQIGNRDPLPKSPLGMFLAEVGKMRLKASRRAT